MYLSVRFKKIVIRYTHLTLWFQGCTIVVYIATELIVKTKDFICIWYSVVLENNLNFYDIALWHAKLGGHRKLVRGGTNLMIHYVISLPVFPFTKYSIYGGMSGSQQGHVYVALRKAVSTKVDSHLFTKNLTWHPVFRDFKENVNRRLETLEAQYWKRVTVVSTTEFC